MTALLPTRVSIYDFLIEDTQPIDSIVADLGHISLPQARILIEHGIQAIVSALLAYNQHQGSDLLIKNLINRNQVKELRKHNAFNTKAMITAFKCGQPVSDVLFNKHLTQKEVCHHLAVYSQLPIEKVKPLLSALVLLCLRELAILVDYSQLDTTEVDCWMNLQSQFVQLDYCMNKDLGEASTFTGSQRFKKPSFDPMWHEITGYKPIPETSSTPKDSIPHYAKVIGRSPKTPSQLVSPSSNSRLIVDKSNESDVLTFSEIDGISLPYQRWLLQLAKISDIYLSRNRLRIAPEPTQAPPKPFVNFDFIEHNLSKLADDSDHSNKSAVPLYKNTVIILLLIVIGGLAIIAIGKAKLKKNKNLNVNSQIVLPYQI